MFSKKLFFVFILFLTAINTSFAQGFDYASVDKFSDDLNLAISENRLLTNNLQINRTKSPIAGGIYSEDIYFYYAIDNGRVVLKKIILTVNYVTRVIYTDFLFDDAGNLIKCSYNQDATRDMYDLSVKRIRTYYLTRQLKYVNSNGDTFNEATFTTEHVQAGIDGMARGEKYKALFDAIYKVQEIPKK